MLLVKTSICTVSSAQPKVDLPLYESGPQGVQLDLELLIFQSPLPSATINRHEPRLAGSDRPFFEHLLMQNAKTSSSSLYKWSQG